ncbi:hypothetical protein M3J09_001284 [Ascochyta lentis]
MAAFCQTTRSLQCSTKVEMAHLCLDFPRGNAVKRCLFFSDDLTYFQCPLGYYTEDSHVDQTRHGWNSGFSNPFNQKFTKSITPFCMALTVYNNLVKGYSNRQHTYHSDSLSAFQVILSSFNTSFGWNFISALPEDAFDLALLWRPMFIADLRPRESSHCLGDAACRVPTWCWTSWIGIVFWNPWRVTSYAGCTVSLRPTVRQYAIASLNDIRGIRKWKTDTDCDNFQEILRDARDYFNKHGTSWTETDRECKSPRDLVLFFRASATEFSSLSIQFEIDRHNVDQKRSNWLEQACRNDAWILDGNGRHCGTLYGLRSTWTKFHNPDLCELILLSNFSQREVKPEDVDAHRASLPLDCPSSHDYYNEVFDTFHYKYTEFWAQNIMLVEWVEHLATRVAVGQIHIDAWAALGSSTKLIALA